MNFGEKSVLSRVVSGFMDRDFPRFLNEEVVNYRLAVKNISLSSWWSYYFLYDRGRRVRGDTGVSKGVSKGNSILDHFV